MTGERRGMCPDCDGNLWSHIPGCPRYMRPPEHWSIICRIHVLEPVAWENEGRHWADPITRAEFERLAADCPTVDQSNYAGVS